MSSTTKKDTTVSATYSCDPLDKDPSKEATEAAEKAREHLSQREQEITSAVTAYTAALERLAACESELTACLDALKDARKNNRGQPVTDARMKAVAAEYKTEVAHDAAISAWRNYCQVIGGNATDAPTSEALRLAEIVI